MRKLLIGFRDAVRRAQQLWMRLRGRTPEGVAEQHIVRGNRGTVAYLAFATQARSLPASHVTRRRGCRRDLPDDG